LLSLEGDLGLYLQVLVVGVLVPIWTIWLGASLVDEIEPDPGAGPEAAPA
jgi:hypothetical protein